MRLRRALVRSKRLLWRLGACGERYFICVSIPGERVRIHQLPSSASCVLPSLGFVRLQGGHSFQSDR
jgi:hypothetical protein